MNNSLAQQAIQKALSGNWDEALELNKEILGNDPNNTDALNRTARAYAELGKIELAKKTAKKVLVIDPFNTIALKAFDKWKSMKNGVAYKSEPVKPQLFLEEPGKTKVVFLINLGDKGVIAKLDAGDDVKLNAHGHKISICTKDSKYLGRLPDDISARMKTLISRGYEYGVWVKSVDKAEVKVFIRELKRSSSSSDVPSFSTEKIDYISFTPPELVHKKESESDGEGVSDEDSNPSEE
ncbi:MAG: hypothetical protein US62_C0017G0026 [Candidatus Woesebacteria bacterium GW2011_GWA1_37_8]|uniref:Uncharacterized protein n=1 Tax=Candidatus Woesebacteria bacterium GW2011_GWA1_37_8 TaxID=1618546 RepID=A0A0G0HSR4_9BACT|nr:MAG: hypothetical protein US62_C0017G0026 [Candidatus Woesebacteria bacterium GW2011_GWA1_37_8]